MLSIAALLVGIILAVILLRRAGHTPVWWTLPLGLLALAALAAGLAATPRPDGSGFILNLVSIALGAAAVVSDLAGRRGARRPWTSWVGLAAALGVVLFWTAFAAAHLLGGD